MTMIQMGLRSVYVDGDIGMIEPVEIPEGHHVVFEFEPVRDDNCHGGDQEVEVRVYRYENKLRRYDVIRVPPGMSLVYEMEPNDNHD